MGRHGDLGLAVDQQAAQVIDIGAVAAQVDRYRQGYRHQAGILTGGEEPHEVGVGLHDQCHAGAGLRAQSKQQKVLAALE